MSMDAESECATSSIITGNDNDYRIFPSSRGFKIAALNVNNLLAHIDEIRILLADCPLDVLAINETKLNGSNSDKEVKVPGYKIKRRDRLSDGGGGICFYIRTSLSYSIPPDLIIPNLENLCIKISKPRSAPLLVATWYRPPDSRVDVFNLFEDLVGKLDATGNEYYLVGDFNCNMISEIPDNDTRLLTNIADVYGLHQLISEPTRLTENSSTLLDVIFTNCPQNIVCSGVLHVGISDHSLVYVYRKLSNQVGSGHTTVTYRRYCNFNHSNFRRDISMQDWDSIEQYQNPNDMWVEWKRMFLSCADRHAPLRTKRVRASKSPWINSDVKRLMHKRVILKKRAIRSKDPSDWTEFRKQRNLVNARIKRAKQAYYLNAFHEAEGDIRNTWRVINELTSRKTVNSSINEIKVNENSITGAPELADTFNTHFSTIGVDLANEIPERNDLSHNDYITNTKHTFELRQTNSSEVFSLLAKLSKSKATGLDRIPARLISECSDLIAVSLCTIFNRSILSGIFPDEWKSSKVIPLFKQGERSDRNNYRPISVTPIVAKVFERIIYNQLYGYLTMNNLISSHQSGFRSLHSTVTALLHATDQWAYNIDKGHVNAVVFLDLKKAFDTVDHTILLSKLEACGVKGSEHAWFKSYLNLRTQKCFVNGSLSDSKSLAFGIPQGTILGPLLFIIYINDLPNCLEFSVPQMYADDTNLTFAANDPYTIESKLNQDLAKVSDWLIANKLTLNISKTEFMVIGSYQRLSRFDRSPALIIDNMPIKQVAVAKSLGVYVDEHLSWNAHISHISKKIASGINALKRCRPFVPFETLIYAFNSIVQPHFDYCDVVWTKISSAKVESTCSSS